MSVRRRLLLASLATLAAGLTILLLLGNVLLDRTIDSLTSRLLRERAQSQIASLVVTGAGVRARQVVNDQQLDAYAWVFSKGVLIEHPASDLRALDRVAVSLGRRDRTAELAARGDVRLFDQPLRVPGTHTVVGGLVVGISVRPFADLKRKVMVGSLAVALLILGAAAVAIQRALRGALDPVRRMTSDAEEWGAHDLERRFGLGTPRDELTGLATTLDHLLDRIAASRRHERRFAADVAHELRTPLSVIRGRVELALDGRADATVEARDEALEAIGKQAERMSATVETLLGIARRGVDPGGGCTDMRALLAELEGIETRVYGEVPCAEGDLQTIRAALAPLLDNARRHARAAVTVELSATARVVRVTVRDDGDGVDPELGERAFDPGQRGAGEPPGGAGLGLPLARRLAQACGGDVSIGAGPGGCFVLELPAVSDGGGA